ncbi:MAG TPA: heparinase II/III family protein, partial [Oceanipulchritudo sp.]|nr:heparinase II/III family protein [Oceanipulchritudo sp.]
LLESRRIGEKFPIIYDFIAPYLAKGGKPYDIGTEGQAEFPKDQAQQVFRTYADLVMANGMINSNHPVLESTCLVYNALALEDESEREKYVGYYLTKDTENQDSLSKVAKHYQEEGDIWPETSQYLNHVATLATRLMLVLTKYDPSLDLAHKYQNILLSLPVLDSVVYPNGEIIRWGDGHRRQHAPYGACEEAYLLGKLAGIDKVTAKLGPVISEAISTGAYHREGKMALMWYEDDFARYQGSASLPRTDRISHAGIYLQRNLSATGNPADGLMGFVGGAHMVHGHAEGMNIELYGKGQVLGVDNGRGRYAVDIHENYSRLFAAHNTVIVNGSSRSEGGWVDLGINTVERISMEPMPREEAVSPLHSFTQTRFEDDKGDKAEATQERTLAIIRTSDTTGYYVDVFRSKSRLPNEYHDYLYHNIGDQLEFENEDLKLTPQPDRYTANASIPWLQNQQYRHPGWHFFEDVQTSSLYSGDVKVIFPLQKLDGPPIFMALHIPGFDDREYTKVAAPRTFEAPKPYDSLPTPTLVMRKSGEAWINPFVVVYEPFAGNRHDQSVQSVEKLEEGGVYKGLKIVSQTDSGRIIQYVITQSKDEVFNDEVHGIHFKGTFAVITLDESGNLQDLYIGEGQTLRYGETVLSLEASGRTCAYQRY